MHLANEIILQALQGLPSIDLKAARLVNRQWSSCAAEFLFDTLYISPHKPNIDVFQSVTQHPGLRGYVRKMAYDGVGFSTEWTYSQYFERLWYQIEGFAHRVRNPIPNTPDDRINSFIRATRCGRRCRPLRPEDMLRIAEEKCGDLDFIKAGYRKWQELALYERKCMENNNFMQILIVGLQGLDRLSTVRLNDGWPHLDQSRSIVEVPVRRIGSPLARSWEFFDVTPLDWSWGCHGSRRLDLRPPGYLAFWNITVALSKSGKRIRNFDLGDGVPPATFDSLSIANERRLLHCVDAFAQLKELRLDIAFNYGNAGHPSTHDKLSNLRVLIDRIRGLEVFELCLALDEEGFETYAGWYTYESIFPKDGAWPHLRVFAVDNLAIRDKELVHLLFARMPSLQHLKIRDMELLDGTWESVLEALKFRRLSSLDIKLSHYLYYGDMIFYGGHGKKENFLGRLMHDYCCTHKDLMESLERYVVHGLHDLTLRHPSLEYSQPTQDSMDYLCGIFNQAHGIRCIVDINFAKLKRRVAEVCAEENWERQMEGKVRQ